VVGKPSSYGQGFLTADCFFGQAGTPTRSSFRRPTVKDELDNRIKLEHRLWTDNEVLSLNIPGAGFSVEVMWLAGTIQLRCWYVHLQEPSRHTKIGFDTMDQRLDIVISPDKSHWYWKDEHEFAEAGAIGLYSAKKTCAIRAEGEKVLQMLRYNASPFCNGWEKWRPPARWTIASFPPGWEEHPL
jgi:hypothetical protein